MHPPLPTPLLRYIFDKKLTWESKYQREVIQAVKKGTLQHPPVITNDHKKIMRNCCTGRGSAPCL